MPELPEVETVKNALAEVLLGRRLEHVRLMRHDLRYPVPVDFVQTVMGRTVQDLRRRGKYMLVDLSGGHSIIWHLGMSGHVLINPGSDRNAKHDHLLIETDDGTPIAYNDPRRFGSLDVCTTDTLNRHRLLADMGPEPLDDKGFCADYLVASLKGRSRNIKDSLLDQRLVAGLGNIYVCEALFRAGIAPRRAAGTIGRGRAIKLIAAIRDVLGEAIAAGGTTLADFIKPDGAKGLFDIDCRVYGREGEPCRNARPDEASHVVERIVQGGRSTFLCPCCQR